MQKIGNKTDRSFLEFAYKLGYNYEEIRKQNNIIRQVPFSEESLISTSVYKLDSENYRVFV